MEAISTPVSTIRPGAFLSTTTPRDPHLLVKPPSHPSYPTLLSHKPPAAALSHPPPLLRRSHSPSRPPPPLPKPNTRPPHLRAATGYAAALLDATVCNGTAEAIHRDVRRLMRTKGAAAGGGLSGHLAALVRMLVNKGKAGLVVEVMQEFQRLYEELTGTRTVVVSSEGRLPEEELAAIAGRVQRASGAVNVRLRHFMRSKNPPPMFGEGCV